MTQEQMKRLWDAINRYAVACGGNPSEHVYGNTPRQMAVADVGRVIRDALYGATEPESYEPNCLNCGCSQLQHCSRGRDDELHECLKCECIGWKNPTTGHGDDDDQPRRRSIG